MRVRLSVTTNCADLVPLQKLNLFRFQSGEDVERFQVTTDKVLGGQSTASLSVKPYKHFSSGKRIIILALWYNNCVSLAGMNFEQVFFKV